MFFALRSKYMPKKNPQSFHLWIFRVKVRLIVLLYLVAGAVTVSILILILSGFVVVVATESVVDVEDCILLVSTAAESELLDDIDDSLVPQLTAIIPKPILNNKNFLIIFSFGVLVSIQ